MIELDRETHIYTPNLPSVTEILKSAGMIDTTWYTEEARQRGSAVHLACEYWDLGDLEEDSVDPAIAGYLQSYIAFRQTQGSAVPEWIEMPLMDKSGTYAGTPDRILVARPRALWDLKTGACQHWHRYQSAAYVNCLDDPFSYSRFGIYLRQNGNLPEVREFPKKEYMADLSIFMAALTIYNVKNQNGIKP
jgi:hypothetical protein